MESSLKTQTLLSFVDLRVHLTPGLRSLETIVTSEDIELALVKNRDELEQSLRSIDRLAIKAFDNNESTEYILLKRAAEILIGSNILENETFGKIVLTDTPFIFAIDSMGRSMEPTSLESQEKLRVYASKLFEKLDMPKAAATSKFHVGVAYAMENETLKALKYLQSAYRLYMYDDDRIRAGMSKDQMAKVHHTVESYEQSTILRKEAIALYEAAGDYLKAFRSKSFLANSLKKMGRKGDAADLYIDVADFFEDEEKLNDAAFNLERAMKCLVMIGDYDGAFNCGEDALDLFEEIGNQQSTAYLLTNLSIAFLIGEEFEIAECHAARAYDIFVELNHNGMGFASNLKIDIKSAPFDESIRDSYLDRF